MSQVSGQGTTWNLPNYAGELYTASPEFTPFLSIIGGMTGGLQSNNFEFAMGSTYDYTAASQPAITETASLTSPTAIENVRAQVTNVCQIFHEAIQISYEKLANQSRLSGLNTQGAVNNVTDDKNKQIAWALVKIARDIEYSFLRGSYSLAANAGEANKTRGIITACSTTAIAAGTVDLSKALIDQAMRTMAGGGAKFQNMIIFANAFQLQSISDIYGFAPTDRSVGGVAIKTILTDFAQMGIIYDPFMPTDTVLFADVASCAPVFQPVPNKGNFFYEELSKTGASENGQIFGKAGLSYGVEYLHGKITGLTTS